VEKQGIMKVPKIAIYILLILISISLFSYLDIKNITFLYDDVYSIFLSKASYSDIWNITASDVHPPLYYWGLKAFTSLFGESLISYRWFSTLGFLATILLGCFPVRKLFDDRVAIPFILLLLTFPVSQYLSTEIRMYSWTMFFVLASALSAFRIYKDGKWFHWISFFFTGLCAAYLHNYGMLSIFGIYLILSISLIKEKRDRKRILLCGILLLLAYLPWLIQLIGQVSAVSEEYWIKPLTLNDLFLHIYYFYSPKEIWLPFTDFNKVQMMISLILIMALQLFLTLAVIISGYRNKDKYATYIVLVFIAFLVPIAIGALVSLTYLPVLVTRYMTCSFGLFVLGLAMVQANSYEKYKWPTIIFFALLLADGCVRLSSGLKYYKQTEVAYQDIRDFTDQDILKPTTFIVNDFSYHVIPRLQLITPGNKYQVLTSDSADIDFRPFRFDKVESLPITDFILVHQDREAIQEDFRRFMKTLQPQYTVVDSLHASDFRFYRVLFNP